MSPDDFTDYWNKGFGVNAGFGHLFAENTRFRGMFGYNKFGLDDEQLLDDVGFGGISGISLSGGSVSSITISGNFDFLFPSEGSNIVPYISAGIGLFRLASDDIEMRVLGVSQDIDGDSESKMGLNFGGGLEIKRSDKFAVMVEGKYYLGFTDDDYTHYIGLNLGIVFGSQ